MEACFETTFFIKNILDSVADITPRIILEIKKEGWKICCIEISGCCIVSAFISEKDMKKYKIDSETEITVEISKILKTLKEMDKDKPITFKYKDGDDKISFYNTSKSGRASMHTSRLTVDEGLETVQIPELKHSAEITINSGDLSKIFKILNNTNDVCRITTLQNKKMVVFSSNSEFGSSREELPIDDTDYINENGHDYFSIPYLIKFLKASQFSTDATLCLTKDNPICIKFEVLNSYVHYYLSPKVEDEDDVAQQGIDEIDEEVQQVDMVRLDSEDSDSGEDVLVTDSEDEEDNIEIVEKKVEKKEEIISDSEEEEEDKEKEEKEDKKVEKKEEIISDSESEEADSETSENSSSEESDSDSDSE